MSGSNVTPNPMSVPRPSHGHRELLYDLRLLTEDHLCQQVRLKSARLRWVRNGET